MILKNFTIFIVLSFEITEKRISFDAAEHYTNPAYLIVSDQIYFIRVWTTPRCHQVQKYLADLFFHRKAVLIAYAIVVKTKSRGM